MSAGKVERAVLPSNARSGVRLVVAGGPAPQRREASLAKVQNMNESRRDDARAALTKRREEIQVDLERLGQEMQWLGVEQEDERGGLGNHLAEDGSSVMEQERIGTVSEDFRDVLRQVDGALARIDDGTYGTCQRCGEPINEERLEAVPYVEFCIECQTFLERQRALYGSAQRVG